jgi:pantothenate kinase, type III
VTKRKTQSRGTLAVAVGNTSVFVGVFAGPRCVKAFRLEAAELVTLPAKIRMNVERAAVCSVVPALTPDVLRLIRRAWGFDARVLSASADHGMKIAYRRPAELGADRVAAALGARGLNPGENLIVVDCGTATTVTAIAREGTIAGGAILPGAGLWPEALAVKTALLPRVPLRRPATAVGRSPQEAIVSGCFYGQLGAIKEVVARVRREAFGRAQVRLVGTGGNVRLFADEGLFDRIEPELVLRGLAEFARRGPAEAFRST